MSDFILTYASMFNPPEEVHERFEATLAVDKSALEQAEARVIGVFDLIVGEKIPTFMIFLGWRDGASRMAGIRRYQNDRTVLACRAEEHTKVGSDVFCISDRYLFEAASLLPSGQDTSPQSLL